MIVVVEGPSAAGKTTWVQTHHPHVAVDEHRPSGREPDRSHDPDGAARFWAEANARRWERALEMEADHGLAVCDTDPFKLHYLWSLWQIGEASEAAWRSEAAVNRELFAAGRLGLADVVFCEVPHRDELRRRRDADPTRTRRCFDLHVRLTEPLRAWYSAVDALDPGRVRWSLPPRGELVDLPAPRPNRSSVELFDRLVDELTRM